MATTTDTTIANTILQQLGGSRFTMMTGAKTLIAHADALSFRLPSRFARDGINYVKVTLTPADTYDVEFGKVWGRQYRVIADRRDVYAEDLRRIFTEVTGLDTSLPQLIARIQSLATLSDTERAYAISDIVDSLLSRTVTVRQQVSEGIGSPVPAYDHKTDGDYSAFLVRNNCD